MGGRGPRPGAGGKAGGGAPGTGGLGDGGAAGEVAGGSAGAAGEGAAAAGEGGIATGGADGEGGAAGHGGEPVPLESPIWARSFGDAWPQVALGLAVRPSGDLFVTGSFHGEVDFGDGTLAAGDDSNAFLASFDSAGELTWSAGFGDNGSQEGRAVAAGADGTVAITGAFSGKIDFGGGELQSQGSSDAFVARFDGSGGHAWSARFGNPANQTGKGIALSSAGDAVVAGIFYGSIDLGGGALDSAGASDVFLAQFDSSGAHDWSVRAGTASPQQGNAVAVSPGGDFFAVGEFQGGVDFGSCSGMDSAGGHDVFLVKLDAGGNCHFSRRFGDAADQYAFGVAHAPGPLTTLTAIVGTFAGALDIGGDAVSAADTRDAYVILQDESGAGWVRRIGGLGTQVARAVAFDAEGNVVVTGEYALSVDGDLLPPSAGGRDLFVIKYSPTGDVLWARRFGGEGDQVGNAIGTDALGYVYVAGAFSGQIPLADQTLESQGYDDIVLLKLAP